MKRELFAFLKRRRNKQSFFLPRHIEEEDNEKRIQIIKISEFINVGHIFSDDFIVRIDSNKMEQIKVKGRRS